MRHFLLVVLLTASTFSQSATMTDNTGLILSKEQKAMRMTRLTDVQGNDVVLKHQPGQVSIIHFWATWCAPCRQELPLLITLANKLHPHGLRVITVAADSHQSVRDYPDLHSLPQPVLIDQYGAALRDYGVQGLPSSYVVNHSGKIKYIATGQIDWNKKQLIDLLKTLLMDQQHDRLGAIGNFE